jgi:hypothetical protein
LTILAIAISLSDMAADSYLGLHDETGRMAQLKPFRIL